MSSRHHPTAEFLAYAIWHRSTDSEWVAGELSKLLASAAFRSSPSLNEDIESVKRLAAKEWSYKSVKGDSSAAKALLGHAISEFRPAELDLSCYEQIMTLSPEEYLEKAREAHLVTYAAIGLQRADPPRVLVVDEYPAPYDKLTGAALAPDRTDRERYGIENAIYFRRERYSAASASLIMAHELAHSFVQDDGELARGFEEGMADFLAYGVIAPRSLSRNVLCNHYSTKRIGYGLVSQRFRLYADYMRCVYFVYNRFGLAPLLDIARQGRLAIKHLERALTDSTTLMTLIGRIDESRDIHVNDDLIDELALMAMEHEVYSPMALLYCMRSSRIVSTLTEKSRESKIQAELQTRTFALVTGDDGSVEFSDFDTPARSRWARFDPHV